MSEMAYSLHLGSNKNRKNISRTSSKNNISNSTSLSNNGIQNTRQLSKVDKHNYRKYDEDDSLIHIIKGTDSVYRDVRNLYIKEFDEARIEYNKKQTRPSRMIGDYFENVSSNEKKDLACEIIIELGDKAYWDTKDLEFKKDMINVYYKQVNDLENLVPNFKIASAIVHLDETSPHLHIVGVPIKDGGKNGMSKQVGKSDVFTKESLKSLQDKMRKLCIEEFNDTYGLDNKLKQKQKGRNKDIHISDMTNYQELKEQIEFNKSAIEDQKKKIDNINTKINDTKDILDNLERKGINKYLLTHTNKKQLESFLKDITQVNNEFERLTSMTSSLKALDDKLKYKDFEINQLTKDKIDLKHKNNLLERDNIDLENDNYIIREKYQKDKYNLMRTISRNIVDNPNNKSTHDLLIDLERRKVLNKVERKLCLKPIFTFSDTEINNSLSKLNKEMEDSAEQFYTQKNDFEI